MLPFVWNPKDSINTTSDDGLNGSLTTIWSFRTTEGEKQPKLGIIPEDHDYFNQDIANKQVFGTQRISLYNKDKTFNLQNLLKTIPAIQIREYTQDTRLDLILSLVDYFKKGFADGSEIAPKIDADVAKELQHLITYDLKNIATNESWQSIINAIYEVIKTDFYSGIYKEGTTEKKWAIDFVYSLYYRLLTTTTTNIYTLPYSANNVLKGNGFEGFNTGFDMTSSLQNSDSKILNFISPSFTLTTTPMWQGMKGGESVNLDITFNLFNDTLEKAITNFIFVHTILPQNLPTQFAVFSQPPSLYDIKIEGGSRLFMCAGNFECNYKGVMRFPANSFFEGLKKIDGLKQHINGTTTEEKDKVLLAIKTNNLIKIPDIYEITMHFKSLLPNNFNNFIFQFSNNANIYDSTVINRPGLTEAGDKVMGEIRKWIKTRADNAEKLAEARKQVKQTKKKAEESKPTDENYVENLGEFTAASVDEALLEEEVKNK